MAFLSGGFVKLLLRARLHVRLFLAVALAFFCSAIHAYADTSELEYRVKSAFLYNFTKFIEWPAVRQRADFVMCVAGSPQLHAKLVETIGNKENNGMPIKFSSIRHPGEAQNCQLVFLGFMDAARLNDWVGALADTAVLTVSDDSGFIEMGGMIQFVIIDGKIRFDINQTAANRSSIKMSSKLLGLARNVN
tara:strand:+ start:11002 stop:11574 length:573 start_codon:yes stop_codon:yes gene_type:complete